jgi:uroporphyrin-3 C-methyltransferase
MTTEQPKTVKKETKQADKPAVKAAPAATGSSSNALTIITLILVMVAFGLMAWFWIHSNSRIIEIERSLSVKLNEYQGLNQQGMAIAKQSDERSEKMYAKTLLIEEKLTASQSQQEVLQNLYHQLASNHEAAVLTEVEQLVAMASQQLRLNGNVKSALLALQSADEPLAKLNTAQATQLSEVLGNDINTLREFPQVDRLEATAQLEKLAQLCEHLPLISERQPTEVQPVKVAAVQDEAVAKAKNFGAKIWDKFKGFVSIDRIDNPEPPLLSPDHRFYLRENLKLRLLTARIALMQRDAVSYQADLKSANDWLLQYYDTNHPNGEKAIALIEQLSEHQVALEIPEVTASIEAISHYKAMLESQ